VFGLTQAERDQRAGEWQRYGRLYALYGDLTRSRLCHEVADVWRLPLWMIICGGSWHALTLIKQLEKMKEKK
jgi:hypothetical protein